MTERPEPRYKKRMSCKVRLGQKDHSGIVLDVSRKGLFVQTNATARVGERVEVILSQPEHGDAITLGAAVRWQRRAPAHLRTVVHSGLGLQISQAGEAYYALLAEAGRTSPVKGRGL